MNGTSQRLECPSLASAVALSLLGHELTPSALHFDRTGRTALHWICETRVPEAHAIIAAAQRPAGDPRSLHATAPDHPYLACLYVQEAVESLSGWAEEPAAVVQIFRPHPQGKLLRVLPAGTVPDALDLMLPFHSAHWKEATALPSIEHAAAAIVGAGFMPAIGERRGEAPRWTSCLIDVSITHPELSLTNLARAHQTALPGYSFDESPYDYCVAALGQVPRFHAAAELAARNPQIAWHGKGQRRALVSARLLAHNAPGRLRDKLGPHLRGE